MYVNTISKCLDGRGVISSDGDLQYIVTGEVLDKESSEISSITWTKEISRFKYFAKLELSPRRY